MAKLVWDQVGQKTYETGVEQAALFVMEGSEYGKGVAWNGLQKVTESPSGAEPTALYANNKKYLNLISNEDFANEIAEEIEKNWGTPLNAVDTEKNLVSVLLFICDLTILNYDCETLGELIEKLS